MAEPTNLEQLTEFVSQTAVLFYLAEQGQNPAVQTYWDALHYVATSLSVGYANIFPVTAAGKAIGAAVQMVGPALSAKALERPGPGGLELAQRELEQSQRDLIAELRGLREALAAARPSGAGAAPQLEPAA
jgi:hypothetical protein